MELTEKLAKYHPGGKELTSTKSAASFSTSSLEMWSGERGRAIRPVRVDSRMPKSEMSLRKESMRVGFAELLRCQYSNLLSLREGFILGVAGKGVMGRRLTFRRCSCSY